MRRLLSSLPVLRCSVERTRLEGSVPKTAGEERTVRNGRFRSCVHCRRGRCPRPAHGPCSLGARPARIGCCSTSFTLALLSEDVSGTLCEPLIAALTAWVTLSYVVCGLVAWWRRPANRFGPLLIIAGFVSFLSTLVWSSRDVLRTLGQALDLVPPVLFLHVFLAFPGWAAEGPVRAELRRDRVRRCDRTRARSDVRRRLRAAQFVASAETSGQGVYRRRAGAITRTLPIDRFCFFERRTIDGPRYVDPGRHVQLAEDVTDV